MNPNSFHNFVTRISASGVNQSFSQTLSEGLTGEWNFAVPNPMPSQVSVVGRLQPIASPTPQYDSTSVAIHVNPQCDDGDAPITPGGN